jgi:hypothetical protein
MDNALSTGTARAEVDQPPTAAEDVRVDREASRALSDVDALGPNSTGRWLVVSGGSEHTFDLDAGTYCRRPRPGHGRFPYDGVMVALTRVERWPRVGGTFFIWVDDPHAPDLVEHWHQSSTIVSITRLPDDHPGEGAGGRRAGSPAQGGDLVSE